MLVGTNLFVVNVSWRKLAGFVTPMTLLSFLSFQTPGLGLWFIFIFTLYVYKYLFIQINVFLYLYFYIYIYIYIFIIIQISADSPNLSRIHHGLNAQRLDDLCTFQTLGAKQQWKCGGLQSLVSCLIQLVTNRSWHKLLRLHELANENFKTSFIGTNKNTTLFGNGSFFFQWHNLSAWFRFTRAVWVPFRSSRKVVHKASCGAKRMDKLKWLIHAKQPENAHNWKKVWKMMEKK